MRPLLLDLFCGAGGAAVGYARAGFEVVGVDIAPQPRYPFEFIQADALEFVTEHGNEFDAIASSPPCQRHSRLAYYQPDTINDKYADLIAPTRAALRATGLPYVIENVPQAPLVDPMELCGATFGLGVYRHRCFETTFPVSTVPDVGHHWRCARNGYLPTPERPFMSIHGGKHSRAWQRTACWFMELPWMAVPGDATVERTREGIRELCEAIPPIYTEYVGRHLMTHLTARAAA